MMDKSLTVITGLFLAVCGLTFGIGVGVLIGPGSPGDCDAAIIRYTEVSYDQVYYGGAGPTTLEAAETTACLEEERNDAP